MSQLKIRHMLSEETLQHLNSEDLRNLKRILGLLESKEPKNIVELQSFADEYLRFAEQSFSKKYIKSLRLSLKKFLIYFGEHKRLNEITIKDVELFIIKMQQTAPKGTAVYY